jgi:hypothetical protein
MRRGERWLLLSWLWWPGTTTMPPAPPRPARPATANRSPIEPCSPDCRPTLTSFAAPADYRSSLPPGRCLAVRFRQRQHSVPNSRARNSDRGCFTRPAVRLRSTQRDPRPCGGGGTQPVGGVALDAYYGLPRPRTHQPRPPEPDGAGGMVAALKEVPGLRRRGACRFAVAAQQVADQLCGTIGIEQATGR